MLRVVRRSLSYHRNYVPFCCVSLKTFITAFCSVDLFAIAARQQCQALVRSCAFLFKVVSTPPPLHLRCCW